MAFNEGLFVPEKRKLYVGCGLTLAPQEFKDQVEELKEELGVSWDVLQFLGVTAGTAADVYEQDIITNVGSCDAFLGIADEPSFGLGFETAVAVREHKKPTLLVAHELSKVTRMAIGAPEFNPNLSFRRYQDMVADVPGIVAEEFSGLLSTQVSSSALQT